MNKYLKYAIVGMMTAFLTVSVQAGTGRNYQSEMSAVGRQNTKTYTPTQNYIDSLETESERQAEYKYQYNKNTSSTNSSRVSEATGVAGSGGTLSGSEFAKSYAELMLQSAGERPMADITSTPVHIIIPPIQYRVHKKTMEEVLANKRANERLSVRFLPNKKMKTDEEFQECTGQDAKDLKKKGDEDLEVDEDDKCKSDEDNEEEEDEDDDEEEEEEEDEDEDDGTELELREIGTRLSRIKLEIDDALSPIKEGLVGDAEQMDLTEDLKKSSYDLTNKEQKEVTSFAGTAAEKEAYAKKRQYAEQEETIRILALAAVLRNNISAVSSSVDAVREHYEKSDAKKDLNKKCGIVKRTTDVNQALRQYIYYSLIYDQMLSLEQQIIGLRLQARGGRASQTVTALSDTIETKSSSK